MARLVASCLLLLSAAFVATTGQDNPCLDECLVDACLGAECPAFPEANCTVDPCKGCMPVFRVEEKDMTRLCSTEDPTTDEVPTSEPTSEEPIGHDDDDDDDDDDDNDNDGRDGHDVESTSRPFSVKPTSEPISGDDDDDDDDGRDVESTSKPFSVKPTSEPIDSRDDKDRMPRPTPTRTTHRPKPTAAKPVPKPTPTRTTHRPKPTRTRPSGGPKSTAVEPSPTSTPLKCPKVTRVCKRALVKKPGKLCYQPKCKPRSSGTICERRGGKCVNNDGFVACCKVPRRRSTPRPTRPVSRPTGRP